MNLARSLSWALYNRFISSIGFALGLAVAGAGVWYGGLTAVEAFQSGAPIESLIEPAAIGAGGMVAGFYVWRLISAVAFYRTVVGATEKRIKKHSGTAQVKSTLIDEFDEHFDELKSDLQQTRKTVQQSNVEDIRDSVEELEHAVRELEQAVEDDGGQPNHERIPDSTGTEQRPESTVEQTVVDPDQNGPVSVPGRGNSAEGGGTDDGDGFGSDTEEHTASQGGFGSGSNGDD
jgi:uncharacterized protein YoxC